MAWQSSGAKNSSKNVHDFLIETADPHFLKFEICFENILCFVRVLNNLNKLLCWAELYFCVLINHAYILLYLGYSWVDYLEIRDLNSECDIFELKIKVLVWAEKLSVENFLNFLLHFLGFDCCRIFYVSQDLKL